MLGSIIGDICGYPYQSWLMTYTDKDARLDNLSGRVTDDSVLTIAIADAILNDGDPREYLLKWFNKYPNAGYGPGFCEWAESGGRDNMESAGNGSAMRISPVGWSVQESSDDSLLHVAVIRATQPSHNSTEAMLGAFCVAKLIHRCILGTYVKQDNPKFWVKQSAIGACPCQPGISLGATLDEMITKWDKQTCRCSVTVPQAVNCFLLSDSYEDCIHKSLLSQGDVDTIACMAGGIAEAFYWKQTGELPIPQYLVSYARERIPNDMLEVYLAFRDTYNLPKYW